MYIKISDLLSKEITGNGVFLIILFIVLFLFLFLGFYILAKACFEVERMSKRPAHNLLKALIIAAAPILYGTLSLIGFEEYIPVKPVVAVCIFACFAVAIWDFKVYGPIGGIMFTIMHIIFGALASLAALSVVFLAVFAVAFIFFGKTISSPTVTNSNGSVSSVRDVSSGKAYNVFQGANGNLYVEDNGRSCLLRKDEDFDGRYYDDSGNEYVI